MNCRSFVVGIFLLISSSINAAVVHDESIQGDLSNDVFNPTFVTLVNGANTFIGSVGDPETRFRSEITEGHDAFAFSLSEGQTINSITLDNYSASGSNEYTVFAMNDNLLLSLFSFETIGTELLDSGEVFGPGSYSAVLIEYNEPNQLYEFTINVTTVPVPASIWLFLSGMTSLIGFARYKN